MKKEPKLYFIIISNQSLPFACCYVVRISRLSNTIYYYGGENYYNQLGVMYVVAFRVRFDRRQKNTKISHTYNDKCHDLRSIALVHLFLSFIFCIIISNLLHILLCVGAFLCFTHVLFLLNF